MNKETKLSIIIPVYNQEKLIRRAVESIPFDLDLEVVIVDDCSTDRTWEAVRELCRNPKVRGYRLISNQGVANARNQGINFSKGEYLMMLDSDDYLHTDNFRLAYKLLDGTDLIYYNLKINNGNVWRLTDNSKRGWCGAVKFIRRDFLGDIRYPYEMRTGEDWQFNEDLLAKNPSERFTDITVTHYNFPRDGSLYDQLIKGGMK